MAWWKRKPRPELEPIVWGPMFAQLLELGSFEAVLERQQQLEAHPMQLDDGAVPLSWP